MQPDRITIACDLFPEQTFDLQFKPGGVTCRFKNSRRGESRSVDITRSRHQALITALRACTASRAALPSKQITLAKEANLSFGEGYNQSTLTQQPAFRCDRPEGGVHRILLQHDDVSRLLTFLDRPIATARPPRGRSTPRFGL